MPAINLDWDELDFRYLQNPVRGFPDGMPCIGDVRNKLGMSGLIERFNGSAVTFFYQSDLAGAVVFRR